jgi:hypothetical protein
MASIIFHTVRSVFEQQCLTGCDTASADNSLPAFLEKYTALIFRVHSTINVKAE